MTMDVVWLREYLVTCPADGRQARVDLKREDSALLVDSLLYASDCGLVLVLAGGSTDDESIPLVKASDVGEFFAGARDA